MKTTRPRLMGTTEICVRLGDLSRQRVNQLSAKTNFPKPIADLAQGRVWLADEIEEWIARHRTTPMPPHHDA
ncbi:MULTISPECIES: AlpA family transcriptional regulator [unclassified Actinoplanes]|uniref:helix-turn-helix transcriptional regulator n=1 Tax=unclassified Actinoplanes TaxID=2626549 RepID=UPI001E3B3A67|nr:MULTISPECIES: AlpA family phage regulatory protein [unclassified Actinoplanes]